MRAASLIAAAACGFGAAVVPALAAPGDGPTVEGRSTAWTPPTVTVERGGAVAFTNAEGVHQLVLSDGRKFPSTLLEAGAGWRTELAFSETTTFSCSIHSLVDPSVMAGKVVVVEPGTTGTIPGTTAPAAGTTTTAPATTTQTTPTGTTTPTTTGTTTQAPPSGGVQGAVLTGTTSVPEQPSFEPESPLRLGVTAVRAPCRRCVRFRITSSEAGRLTVAIRRRGRQIGSYVLRVRQGTQLVTLKRTSQGKRLKAGRYSFASTLRAGERTAELPATKLTVR